MQTKCDSPVDVPAGLLEQIGRLPVHRDVAHCGTTFQVSPFDIYAVCPACRKRVKVRAFAGTPELEDVFDAVFAWMGQPEARAAAEARLKAVQGD